MSTVIRQMSIKEIGSDPKDAIRSGKQVYMGRVWGEAAAVVSKEDRKGQIYHFAVGEFRARNNKGEEFESDKLFLPGSISDKLFAEIRVAEGEKKSLAFGFDVFSNPDNSSLGYSYSSRSILKTAVTDRLKAMSEELAAIPMPGTEPVPMPGTEPAKAPEAGQKAPEPAKAPEAGHKGPEPVKAAAGRK
jgi:hypothetical protein